MEKRIYWIAVAILFLVGISFYAWSFHYSWYTIPSNELYHNLTSKLTDGQREDRSRQWYEEMKKLETPRKTLHDAGEGFISLFIILVILKMITGFPLRDSRTPKKKWAFITIYLAALFAQIPISVYYYNHRQNRFEYPPWADSIFIGTIQTMMICAFLSIVGVAIWLLLLWKVKFPAPLWIWPDKKSRFNIIVTIGILPPAVLALSFVISGIYNGYIGGIILGIISVYLFLSVRAGLIMHYLGLNGFPNITIHKDSQGWRPNV